MIACVFVWAVELAVWFRHELSNSKGGKTWEGSEEGWEVWKGKNKESWSVFNADMALFAKANKRGKCQLKEECMEGHKTVTKHHPGNGVQPKYREQLIPGLTQIQSDKPSTYILPPWGVANTLPYPSFNLEFPKPSKALQSLMWGPSLPTWRLQLSEVGSWPWVHAATMPQRA